MQEPTDDQLDGLFRKSGEEFDIPFDPAAWQDMKSRLDNHDRYSAWEHMLRWGMPVLLLLILTAGSWNAYHKQVLATSLNRPPVNQTNVRSLPGTVTTTPATSDQPTASTKPGLPGEQAVGPRQAIESANPVPNRRADASPNRPNNQELPALSASEVRGTSRTAISAPTSHDRRPASDAEINAVGTAATTAPVADTRMPDRIRSESNLLARSGTTAPRERLRTGLANRSTRRSRTNSSVRVLPANTPASPYPTRSFGTQANRLVSTKRTPAGSVSNSETNEPLPGISAQPVSDVATPVVLLSFDALTNRPGQWPSPLPFRGRDVVLPTTRVEQPAVAQPALAQPASSARGLSVRFLVSPDLSSIGLRELQRPGTNVGIMAEYRLAPRWSIQAGVLRSTKIYKAYPNDYEWPSTWTSATRPLSVDGSCRMFDIPINLRYDLVIRPRSDGRLPDRWFVSGGATTYYINREDYVYAYPAHTYNVPKEWHGSTGWNGFSQLNLSGGFERSFSRRLSWQVEPFMKVPLKGVGFFKIDLLSTGAFFSLRYKL
ncbi:hypothetical protein [Spirosoma rigui]|uniref:hypothetical protein n=1 Tax=Spirosoma rigui TaxID=564064 RepID=UPI0009B0D405|nr:hypothetical protein [Spirosoma rigui]